MYIDKDAELQRKVQDALANDPESKLYDIKADVVEGDVLLTGIVDTMADRERLYKNVTQLSGVNHIEQGITLATDGDITDRGVEFEVAEELHADPRVDTRHIGVKSIKGKVFLVGNSDNPEEIEAAKEAASKARGVTEVISQVKTHAREPNLETIFHNQVRNDQED
ncbi:MAG: hypothetical protein APF84_02145 [Gracilibacter sp. BRH_c7a]|nr:MAG: hypothetical protein APF84_02145 [Gracilibacter sp. BRH_c7a]